MKAIARPGSEIVIRRAGTGDAEAVASVLQASFAAYRPRYTAEGFRATALSAAQVLERMREGPVWVALRGEAAVGTASAVVTGQGCYVRGMAVLPDARGLGLGRALLERIELFAREEGLPALYLSTTPFLERAIALYEKYGFRRRDGGPTDLFGTPLFTMVKSLTTLPAP